MPAPYLIMRHIYKSFMREVNRSWQSLTRAVRSVLQGKNHRRHVGKNEPKCQESKLVSPAVIRWHIWYMLEQDDWQIAMWRWQDLTYSNYFGSLEPSYPNSRIGFFRSPRNLQPTTVMNSGGSLMEISRRNVIRWSQLGCLGISSCCCCYLGTLIGRLGLTEISLID